MAKIGRNQPCPCRSGRKAKRCCGTRRGPSEEELARAFPRREGGRAARTLVAAPDWEETIRELAPALVDLPARHGALRLPLPRLLTPELSRLLEAFADDDPDRADADYEEALAAVDTPRSRAGLARAIIALRDRGELEEALAAVALLDLSDPDSTLVQAAFLRAVAVHTGVVRTPEGLVVAGSV